MFFINGTSHTMVFQVFLLWSAVFEVLHIPRLFVGKPLRQFVASEAPTFGVTDQLVGQMLPHLRYDGGINIWFYGCTNRD